MKKLILLGLTIFLFASCQQTEQRYFDDSAEIETVKLLYKNIESGNYDDLRAMYNDTATVKRNTTKAISIDELIAENKKGRGDFSSFKFRDSIYTEMVITKSGNTWVNSWATWVGKVQGNDNEIVVPLHLSFRFVDGLIVEDEGYWNSLPIYLAMEKAKADKAAAEMEAIEE